MTGLAGRAATVRRRDILAGLLCLGAGIGALAEARGYSIGSPTQVGPGFYPAILGGLLALVGLLITVSAFVGATSAEAGEALPERPDWRGWACIIAGVLVFIGLAWTSGLAPAIFGTVFISALGDRSATLRGSLLLALGMAITGTVLFGYLLGINMPLWQVPTLR
jgi:hypothetical protein